MFGISMSPYKGVGWALQRRLVIGSEAVTARDASQEAAMATRAARATIRTSAGKL